MSAPLFTVVIPTYNRARRARAAALSVIGQTDPGWECLIVDDGSTDDTRALLQPLQDVRLTVLWAAHRGQHACRNEAIRRARGEWIVFLDSDDLFLPTRLAVLREAIARRPTTGFWFCNAFVHRHGRIVGTLFHPARPIPEGRVPGYYAVGSEWLPYVTSTVAARRAAFERTGFFREDLRILEDTELYARMLNDGLEVGVQREPLVVQFLHEGQITRDYERDFEESLIALRCGAPPPEEERRIRLKTAKEVAGHLWRALKPAAARALLQREFGPKARHLALYWATFLPVAMLTLLRAARTLWLRLRHHPALAGAERAAAYRLLKDLGL